MIAVCCNWKTLLSYGTCDVIPRLRNLCPGMLGL